MQSFTELLVRFQSGDTTARENLFSAAYAELKRIASGRMCSERRGHTMQITDLVHETYLRMARSQQTFIWRDRLHFFAHASKAMRHILVDHARARMARKRSLSGDEAFHGFVNPARFMDLHEALDRLALIDSRQAQIVELRYFGGFMEDEIAASLGVSARTVKRDWKLAKAWLYGELSR